jgi:hypothetical protein
MRPAARFIPPPDVDEGWRDLISSAPPPPPRPPREAYEQRGVPTPERVIVPEGVRTDRHGCVAQVQFGGASVDLQAAERERPSFDASDRRMWMVASGLMGLATLVLLVLGVLTFKAQATLAPGPSMATSAPASRAPAKADPAPVPTVAAVGTARPLIAQHALRHSKHARKHRKLAAR